MKFVDRDANVYVEAIQFDGNNYADICQFVGKENLVVASGLSHITILLADGSKIQVQPTAYIVKNSHGLLSPWANEVFNEYYLAVE